MSEDHSVRLIAGCMSGTSIDGVDAALVEVRGRGLQLSVEFRRGTGRPFGPLAERLRKIAGQQPVTAAEIAAAARDLGHFHLDLLRELVGNERVDLIAVHGQTVVHRPDPDGDTAPVSWQLINPAPIAAGLEVPVVYDLRAMDIAAGGQGAPLTPLTDFITFRADEARAIINLGGFCNITRLPAGAKPEDITGGDVCACNQVLDGLARALLAAPYDEDGQQAAQGAVREDCFRDLHSELAAQAEGKRSLGTGDEAVSAWLGRFRERHTPEDLARSACAAVAQVIAAACSGADNIIAAGGGIRNRTLMQELAERAQAPVVPSDELGMPAAYREAAAMAVLGALCQDRVPITLPQVTGVRKPPVSGSWIYP